VETNNVTVAERPTGHGPLLTAGTKTGLSEKGETVMRILSAACSIAIVFSTCAAQGRDDPYSMRLVQSLLHYPAQLGSGFTEKQLNRLGDRVSIALVKSLQPEDLKNPQEIRQVLAIIGAAFLAPQLIVVPEDKKPAVTLLLLNYLEATVQDEVLKKEIVDLTSALKERTAPPR
jgi:hypothetical protein